MNLEETTQFEYRKNVEKMAYLYLEIKKLLRNQPRKLKNMNGKMEENSGGGYSEVK